MQAALSAPGSRANQPLREVVGTKALAGAWVGRRPASREADGWAEAWGGMPPSSGEPRLMRRAMRATSPTGLAAEHLRLAAERFAHIDYATDLGSDIGSARWWRGLTLMLALSASALAFWPGFAPQLAPPHLAAMAAPTGARLREAMATGAAMDADAPATTLRRSAPPRPQIALATTLADGDTYSQMLQRVGVGGADAEQVSALMGTAIPMGYIAPGTSFSLSLDADGNHALQRVEFRTRTDLVVAIERRGDSFELGMRGSGEAVTPLPPPPALSVAPVPVPLSAVALPAALLPSPPVALAPTPSPMRIRGLVGASLYRSARAAGAPAMAVQQYLQTLGAHMDVAGLRPNDTFDIILGHEGAGHPDALLYAGLERNGRPEAALVRWGQGRRGGDTFLDAVAPPAQAAPAHLLMPVAGKVTSGFGMRFHPILGFTRMHEGIDLSAPYGAPIYAVAPGTVSYAGLHGGHGKYVRLEHSGGLGTGYAHMSRIAVAPGTHVRAGEVIGYVGSSGLSTGAHLHYEVYRDGEAVNPLTVRFGAAVRAVMPRNLGAVRARLAKLLMVKPR